MWSVRLYKRTGLNTVNTIDKPSRLADADYLDVPALDILQGEHLSSIRIKATRAQVKDVDYLSLTDTESGDVFYYAVDPFMMSSMDVTTLSITIDSVMTAAAIVGDIKDVDYGDGIVERCHIRKEADVFGACTEDDPYIVPSQELEAQSEYVFKQSVEDITQGAKILVESTLDLLTMGADDHAITYTDEDTGKTVVVPQVAPVDGTTTVSINNLPLANRFVVPGAQYFDYSDELVQKGVARCRALGVEGGILNSYIIPQIAIKSHSGDRAAARWGVIEGDNITQQSTIPYEYGNVQNKRLLYGNCNMYELRSVASGMSVSFKPEDIYNGGNAPAWVATYDVRPNGRPYFRSRYYRGLDVMVDQSGEFFGNAVAGGEWANAPLVYTSKSGGALAEIDYNTQKQNTYADAQAQNDIAWRSLRENLKSSGGRMIGETLGALGQGDAIGALTTPLIFAGESHNKIEDQTYASQEIARRYKQSALTELQNYMIGQSVVQPVVHFPQSPTMRDFIGNGLYVIKYKLSSDDLTRLDKILNMYGYRYTVAMTGAVFSSRSKYNYVRAHGVSVIDKRIPLWLRNTLASQLDAGVRVWHQLPDKTAYTDGSNT